MSCARMAWWNLVFVCSFSLYALDASHAADARNVRVTASGVPISVTKEVPGAASRDGDTVVFHYVSRSTADGRVIEDTHAYPEPVAIQIGKPTGLIKELSEAVTLLRAGERALLVVPVPFGSPSAAGVRYEIEVFAVKRRRLAELMFDKIESQGLDGGRKLFNTLRKQRFNDVYEGSGQLNYLGYAYLYRFNRVDVALQLFKWNVALYPRAGGLRDSLAEAYFILGDRQQALKHYKEALELAPGLQSATRMISGMTQNPQSPTEFEQLRLLLKHASAFRGYVADVPLNSNYLIERVEKFVAGTSPAQSAERMALVQQLFTVVDNERERTRTELYERFKNQRDPNVKLVASLEGEVNRRATHARLSAREKLTSPWEGRVTTTEGQEVDATGLRGKVTLLSFWATWSESSVPAMPKLVSLYERYKQQGLEIIGVSLDASSSGQLGVGLDANAVRSADQVRDFAHANGMIWPQIYDGKGWDGLLASEYSVTHLPMFILLDADGRFRGNLRAEQLDAEILQLLNEAQN